MPCICKLFSENRNVNILNRLALDREKGTFRERVCQNWNRRVKKVFEKVHFGKSLRLILELPTLYFQAHSRDIFYICQNSCEHSSQHFPLCQSYSTSRHHKKAQISKNIISAPFLAIPKIFSHIRSGAVDLSRSLPHTFFLPREKIH